jgi:hypothetical protein
MNRAKYFDTVTGNEIDESVALDRHGVLKDGCSLRVPLQIRDAAQQTAPRITDGSNNPFALNKPGFRMRAGDTRRNVAVAYKDYDVALVNAYRCGDHERDSSENFGSAGSNRERLPRHGADNKMVKDHRARMNELYADHDRELANAWRQP